MAKQKKSPTRRLLIIAFGFIVVFGIGAVLARAMGWLGNGNEGKEVETAEAKLKTITQIVSASGKIQPEVEVIIFPEVSGEIITLEVKEGDYVNRGDLLVRIKPDIYQARIEEINASLLMQKARREQAKATMLKSEAEFNRQKQLYERGVSSEAEFIQAKTTFEAEQANYSAAQYQVQSVEAQLAQAREELEKTVIRAPKDGTVSSLAVEEGERVLGQMQMSGTELMRIADMNHMEVQVDVNENDIVSVTPGDTANIEVDAYPDRTFHGVVTEIANSAIVTGEGTSEEVTNYEVKVRVTTPHNLGMAGSEELVQQTIREMPEGQFSPDFKPGMSATVDIETETAHNVVSVPIQAVTVRNIAGDEPDTLNTAGDSVRADTSEGGDSIMPREELRKVVFVVKEGKAVRYTVETGISDNTHIQIVSGVDTGDEVVTGSYRTLSRDLNDGDKVNVNNNRFAQFAAGE